MGFKSCSYRLLWICGALLIHLFFFLRLVLAAGVLLPTNGRAQAGLHKLNFAKILIYREIEKRGIARCAEKGVLIRHLGNWGWQGFQKALALAFFYS